MCGGATDKGLDAAGREKSPVPKGWRLAGARVVMPLARCDGIAPSAMPGGSPRQAAIGIDSIWSENALDAEPFLQRPQILLIALGPADGGCVKWLAHLPVGRRQHRPL